MSYNYLLEKLKINDFILRGEYGAAVLDLILDYAKINNQAKLKSDAELQGLPLEVLQNLLELDQPTLAALLDKVEPNSDLPFEKPQEYLDLEAKVIDLQKQLEAATTPEEKQTLTNLLAEAEQALGNFRQAYWQKQILSNPGFLLKNSKFLLQLIRSLNKPMELNEEYRQKMLKIRREIEINFLLMKGYTFAEAEQIAKGTHPLSLTNREFLDLLAAIIENDDYLNNKKVFFTSILN